MLDVKGYRALSDRMIVRKVWRGGGANEVRRDFVDGKGVKCIGRLDQTESMI